MSARVLDPFGGAGTTALAAALLGRHGTCIELSDEYCHLARERIARVLRPGTHVPTAGAEVLPLWGKGAQT